LVGLALTLLGVTVVERAAPRAVAADKKDAKKAKVDAAEAERKLRERQAEAEAAVPEAPPAAPATPATAAETTAPNLFTLWFMGGPLMVPITLMSFIVVLFSFERLLGLRRGRVVPRRLVAGLGQLASRTGAVDPKFGYQLCQQYPSTLANVLRSVLLKVGRPVSEIEHTLSDASEREAAKLYANVRTINLATTVTPLLGLLGTVQGMIECFFITAHLPVGANKSEYLANGIYIALVTTFGGLVVAIPASVVAHYFEGRIQALMREIDEIVLGLMPKLECFEGKVRMVRQPSSSEEARKEEPRKGTPAEAPPVVEVGGPRRHGGG
jgi:biopolymer transport protein ExbB